MRIIAGEFKGHSIAPPVDKTTRPMLARVREALFSTLGSLIDDAVVLDLFSGTGSLGLEALSRGAAQARFIERDRRAVKALYANVATLGVEERADVRPGNAMDEARWGDSGLDLAFLDPPYPWFRERDKRASLFAAVQSLLTNHIRPGGALVLHTHPRDVDAVDFGLTPLPEKRVYGNTALWYVWQAADTSPEESPCS